MQAPQFRQSQIAVSGMALFRMGDRLRVLRVAGALVADLHHVVFQVLHDMHRRKQLPRHVRRADVGTAATNSAGIPIQQLLPGEVLHSGGSEPLGILKVHGRQSSPRVQGPEECVDRRSHHVHVLGEWYIHREEQDYGEVYPPEESLQNTGCRLADAPVNEQSTRERRR